MACPFPNQSEIIPARMQESQPQSDKPEGLTAHSHQKRRWLVRLSLLAGSTALGLGLVEIGLRVSGYVPYYHNPSLFVASEDREIGYELAPNFRGLFYGGLVTTDAHGVRTSCESLTTSVQRLVLLGDSVAFGHGVNDDQTIAHFLPKEIRRISHRPWDVVNLAVPGYGIDQIRRRCLAHRSRLRPKCVVYLFHPNDIWPNPHLRSYRANDGTFRRAVWTFANGHCCTFNLAAPTARRALRRLRGTHRRADHALRRYYDEPGAVGRLKAELALMNKDAAEGDSSMLVVLFVSPALLRPGMRFDQFELRDIYQKVESLLKAARIPYVIPFDDMAGRDPRSLVVRPYDDHLSEKGSRLMASIIARALRTHGLLTQTEKTPVANLSRQ